MFLLARSLAPSPFVVIALSGTNERRRDEFKLASKYASFTYRQIAKLASTTTRIVEKQTGFLLLLLVMSLLCCNTAAASYLAFSSFFSKLT